MFKAFLSHSSNDKEFVRAVANDLGRQFCLFDEQVFENAQSFKESIEKMLDDSKVFVLFASEDSLSRMWVQFEIDEVWYRKIEGKISKALVFLIDSNIDHRSVPVWLNRAKISRVNVAKLAAREIRQHLDELLRAIRQPYFEGRNEDIERLQRLLTPFGEMPPRIVGIHGLPSVGRRTFVAKACQLSLSFNRTLHFLISDGDQLQDVAIKVANLLEPYSTKEGFENIVLRIRSESEEKVLGRIVRNLRVAAENRELSILFDDGGLLTPDGSFSEVVRKIINAVEKEGDLYLFVVSNRKPPLDIPSIPLRPLTEDHTRRLITKIALDERVVINPGQVAEIAEYVNGYPPSAYYAVGQAKTYGVHSVISDKARLVKFRASAFVKYLKSQTLSCEQRSILMVLARYSPVPLRVLSDSLGMDMDKLLPNIITLVDHSLVVPNETGLYEIASPVADAIVSEFQKEVDLDHGAVFKSLEKVLAAESEELPRLQLYRLLFKAAIRTGSRLCLERLSGAAGSWRA